MKRSRSKSGSKRRTTLTLPSDSLTQAQRIAAAGNVTLSTVVAEALSQGLRMRTNAERAERILAAYKTAFGGFSEEEVMLLDGVVFEAVRKRR